MWNRYVVIRIAKDSSHFGQHVHTRYRRPFPEVNEILYCVLLGENSRASYYNCFANSASLHCPSTKSTPWERVRMVIGISGSSIFIFQHRTRRRNDRLLPPNGQIERETRKGVERFFISGTVTKSHQKLWFPSRVCHFTWFGNPSNRVEKVAAQLLLCSSILYLLFHNCAR